jgi:biotin-dependent carboxylase-like uncharacterized protein
MSPALAVVAPGLHTTVQDLGRWGHQAIGVPVSGALDGAGLRLANALAGNPPGSPAFEILGAGPSFEVLAETVRLAAFGAAIEAAGIACRGQSVTLAQGARCRIVLDRDRACGYVAVEGGIAVPPVLGSAATFVRGGLGGFDGRALREGDAVPLARPRAAERPESRLARLPEPGHDRPIRVVLGPQHDLFTEAAVATLLEAEFRVSADADRMGMRLGGPPLRHRAGWDIVSDAIATGAIQVPGSGRPILLLADHQTTGGYPKIATVVSADLPVVGRRRPGDAIRFAAVGVEEAEQLARAAERELAALLAAIEPVPASVAVDLAALWAGNLISGVVSARD